MNAESFSEAMEKIEPKYIEETLFYKRSRSSMIYKRIAVCAVLCLIVSCAIFLSISKPSPIHIYYCGTEITDTPEPVVSVGRSIAPPSELSVLLEISTDSSTRISVDNGVLYVSRTDSFDETEVGTQTEIKSSCLIRWVTDGANTDIQYTMSLLTGKREENVIIKYNDTQHGWTVYKK